MTCIYIQLSHEEYKSLEKQLEDFRKNETTHRTVPDGGYHKAFRLKVNETLVYEFIGPIVKVLEEKSPSLHPSNWKV